MSTIRQKLKEDRQRLVNVARDLEATDSLSFGLAAIDLSTELGQEAKAALLRCVHQQIADFDRELTDLQIYL